MTPQFVQDAAREAAERITIEAVDWGDEHTDGAINESLVERIILAAIQRAVREAGVEEALQELRDCQNGPPLFTWEKEWSAAMEKTDEALARVRAILGTGEATE